MLAFGVWPRRTAAVVYTVLTWSLLADIVGGFGGSGPASRLLLDSSVFHQMASAPAASPNWAANAVMAAVGAACALLAAPSPSAGGTWSVTEPMTTDQPKPQKDQNRSIERTVAPPGQSTPVSPAAGDLTARARIRDAAIRHFADEGYERTTIRGIAATAGVSPGLLRHHFGSKEELRRACDEHIAETLRRINAQYLDDMGGAAADRRQLQPFERYVVRALAENSPSAAPIFDEMVTMTEHWLERADEARPDRPAVDRRIRAALISAMASGIPLLHEQLSRTVGADIFGAEGGRLVALGLLDIYSHPLISSEDAAAGETGID